MKQLSLPLKYYIRDPKEVFKRFQDMGYFPDYTERAGIRLCTDYMKTYQLYFSTCGKFYYFVYHNNNDFKPGIICETDDLPKNYCWNLGCRWEGC